MAYTTLASNIYLIITLYIACNLFICTILFGLLESSKINLLKDFILTITKFKVTGKNKKSHFPRLWPQLFFRQDI